MTKEEREEVIELAVNVAEFTQAAHDFSDEQMEALEDGLVAAARAGKDAGLHGDKLINILNRCSAILKRMADQ